MIDYDAAEDAYMKVTGGVSPRGIRNIIAAALSDTVLYEIRDRNDGVTVRLASINPKGFTLDDMVDELQKFRKLIQFYPEVNE